VIEATDAVLANANGLNDYPQLLLASLFLCEGHCGREGWRIATMTAAFRDLLEQKGLGDGECRNFRIHLDQVVGYKLIERINKGDAQDTAKVRMVLSAVYCMFRLCRVCRRVVVCVLLLPALSAYPCTDLVYISLYRRCTAWPWM
jgi:hypothetical protein